MKQRDPVERDRTSETGVSIQGARERFDNRLRITDERVARATLLRSADDANDVVSMSRLRSVENRR